MSGDRQRMSEVSSFNFSVFNNCTSHGICVQKPNPRKTAQNCYFCSCTVKTYTDPQGNPLENYKGPVKWVGSQCELQAYTNIFHIGFWTVLVLLLVCIVSISLLYSISPFDNGSNEGHTGKAKTE